MILDRKCLSCSTNFPGGPRAYYCPACRVDRRRQAKARYQQKKRLGIGIRHIGSTDRCERCNELYTVESGLQRFCPKCQPIHAAEYDAKTSLSFYHANKEGINPVRNERRLKGQRKCVWCDEIFDSKYGRVTCSEECKRQHYNRWQRENRKRMSAQSSPDNKALTPNQKRRDYFREREQLRRKERERNDKCPQCGGEWIEPIETHRGKPKHCRKCQEYYKARYNDKKLETD